MGEYLNCLRGDNGELELYDDKIIIKREGTVLKIWHGFKGNKTIYLNQIASVQVKEAKFLFAGYIQITLLGEGTKDLENISMDENTVTFSKDNNSVAYEIQRMIEELKSNIPLPETSQSEDTIDSNEREHTFNEGSPHGQTSDTEKTKKGNLGCMPYFIVALCTIIALFTVSQVFKVDSSKKTSIISPSENDNKTSAWIFAQDAVKEKLKAPSTATFPWYSEGYITKLDDGRYLVKAYVDAENSFGAKIRNDFSVKIRITGENSYTYAELSIE